MRKDFHINNCSSTRRQVRGSYTTRGISKCVRRFRAASAHSFQHIHLLYTNFITLGHMTETTDTHPNKVSCVLLHHGVLRENSLSTRLRTVFDESAVMSSGKSLNNIQHIGPYLQDDIISILIRFRQHKIVVTADIK